MVQRQDSGWRRALVSWLMGATPLQIPAPSSPTRARTRRQPVRIAHYAITRKIGEGGMGIV